MGKLTAKIDDKVWKEFKDRAKVKFGQRRGSIKKAAEEAILQWIDEKKKLKAVNPLK